MPDRAPYVNRENRLVREWLASVHPNVLQWKNVRVGPIPGSEQDKVYSGLRRWVDIVYKEGAAVFLVEAKMRPMPEALAQLELYLRLWPQTPEFEEYKDLPAKGVFLTTMPDEYLAGLAAEKGIEYVVYNPPWVQRWWAEVIAKKK